MSSRGRGFRLVRWVAWCPRRTGSLRGVQHNDKVVFVVPDFQHGRLPEGVHPASWSEIVAALGWNVRRRWLLAGFRRGVDELQQAGCRSVWLDGSFVTDIEAPRDFDACWDPAGVELGKLDPVLRDMSRGRIAQKIKYGGEFLPNVLEIGSGLLFVEFFQFDRDGNPKGIVLLDLRGWVI